MEFGGSSISVKDERKEFAEMHFKRLKREGFRLRKLLGTWYFVINKKRCHQMVPVHKIINLATSYHTIAEKLN